MTNRFINGCRTLDAVKREYKRLAMINHPDRGGSTEIMQQINQEYSQILKNPMFDPNRLSNEVREDFIQFPDILNQIILYDITIEVRGSWIWLSGNTRNYKDQLKKIGFFFAPKKQMWYWRPKDFKSANNRPKDMDYIRTKYGSDVIPTMKAKALKDEEATI